MIRLAMAGWDMLFFDNSGFEQQEDLTAQLNRGRYLVEGPGHCSTCHTPRNMLGAEKEDQYLYGATMTGWHSPDITPAPHTLVGSQDNQAIARYLKTGTDGKAVAGGPMAEAVKHSLQYMTDEDIQAIWHNLEPLTQWQVAQLINNKPPFIKGWTELLNYSHKFGSNPQQFSRYLHLWQQHYPAHPAVTIISQLQTPQSSEQPTENTLENIAILLPLTGSQQKAGLAVQQGILAAFDNDSNRNLFFIDTNQLDWQSLGNNFTQLKIDHIIGPLLKANVETFLNSSAEQIPLQIPTLLLNLPYQHSLADTQFALSMRPEDEAIQAAATLSQHNYHNPIVISHNDRVSKRIAIAFREQWQLSTNNTIEIVYFDQGKQMQANLKESLDVNASQTRIKQLNARLKHNIESEPRNRRDIDMIYLVGSSAQTRLIKPYIDVNISPFAKVIPVFASSRSHSDFNDKNTASSISDLQGLTFTQIPWLLNSKQQNKTLSRLSESLWPMRTDSLSRIFAMGYDSYHLLSKLTLMRQAPYIRHFGQTGVLKLSNNNILTRSLIWGQYKNDRVIEVAMD